MSKRFGFDKLADQIAGQAAANVYHAKEWSSGDSEIEKLFYVGLCEAVRFGAGLVFSDVRTAATEDVERHILTELFDDATEEGGILVRRQDVIVIRPQAQIDAYRVDFLLHILATTDDGRNAKWRKLVVECDGHDFHERTKEQAAKDRSRDRELSLLGFQVFRFTGSELWRNPLKCVRQVIEWGLKEASIE